MNSASPLSPEPWALNTQGLKVSGWRSGPKEGPLFLACHGWLDNADSFVPLAEQMPDLRLISIDWPGHGHSEHLPSSAHYHFVDWSDALYQITKQLDEPVFILGHSMGAMAATLFASAFPEKVLGLVLIEGFGPLSSEPEQAIHLLKQSLLSRERYSTPRKRKAITLAQAVQARRIAGVDLSEAMARLLCLRNLKPVASEQYRWRTDPKLRALSPLRMTEPQAECFMANLNCPVLAIVAEQGHEFVRQALQHRAHLVGQLASVFLNGGHHLHMTHAQDVASQIDQWLIKVCSSSNGAKLR